MVDFRKCFPALAVVAIVLGSAVTASAQITPSLSCVSNAGATPTLRAEGIAELVGDVVLNCTGGIPTPVGSAVPQVNITVILNTNVTSRLVSDPFSEALILIDDPAPGQQVPCILVNCPVAGVGGNSGVFFKNAGNAAGLSPGTVPNVYQGRNAGVSAIQWLGVPIDPPGSNATRTIRITNVRANASQLGTSSTLIPTQIQMFISITPSQSLPLNNPQQTVGFVSPGLTFSLRTATSSGTTSGITFLQCVSNNADISADNTKVLNGLPSTASGLNGVSVLARFTEGFPSSFKRRNVAPLSSTGGGGATAFNADVSPTPVNQDTPGGTCSNCAAGLYFTETGFYNQNFTTTNGLNRAGLADHGTRLMLRFAGVPAGAQIFVGTYETPGGVALTSNATSRVRLVSTDASGAGAFSAITPTSSGLYAPVALTGGAGIAVYEVMNSDPIAAPENIDVPVVVAFTSNTATNNPGLGTSTVTGSFAPLSTVVTQSASAPLPRFADVPSSKTAFIFNACSTNLLFPFVTNQAGFDTGIAIANTSLDPFGTKTQQGACVVNYYGNTTGGGAAPAAATSPVVAAGTELIFLLSSGGGGVAATPGFQGYIIAQCAFQYAHGFAFISDLGSQKLAEGYLALVMDSAAATLPRSKTASEPLAH